MPRRRRSAAAGLALTALAAGAGADGAQAPSAPALPSPIYLECRIDGEPEGDRGNAVMVDRSAGSVVWMRSLGDGRWRRATFEIVATTPGEVVARAARAGELEHLTVDLTAGEWRLERPRPRGDNAKVWDAASERMGYGEQWQLYEVQRGPCQRVE